MSDRIAVMHRGRVEQLGTPEDLYDRPATPFVADFIGTTNLLSGTVASLRDADAVVRLASGDTCLVGAAGCVPGQSIEFSIRPESVHIEAVDDGPSGLRDVNRPNLRGAVEQVAYLGSAVQYHVRTEGGL